MFAWLKTKERNNNDVKDDIEKRIKDLFERIRINVCHHRVCRAESFGSHRLLQEAKDFPDAHYGLRQQSNTITITLQCQQTTSGPSFVDLKAAKIAQTN